MSDITASTIAIQNAIERTRQETAIFEEQLVQERRWFHLRLTMGYVVVVLLLGIALISGYILVNETAYSGPTRTAAAAALFVDVLGLIVGMFRVVLPPQNATKLTPVTGATDLSQLQNMAPHPPIVLASAVQPDAERVGNFILKRP
jgi:hypothetical protein